MAKFKGIKKEDIKEQDENHFDQVEPVKKSGRPKKTAPLRDHKITLYLTENEMRTLDAAADLEGLDKAVYARTKLLKAVRGI